MAQQFLSSVLPRRGPKAFEKFIAALMSCEQQKFIAERLDPELAERYRTSDAEESGNLDHLNGSKSVSQKNESDDEITVELKLTGYISRFCFYWYSAWADPGFYSRGGIVPRSQDGGAGSGIRLNLTPQRS